MSDSQDMTPFISCSFELIPNMTQDRFELSMVSLYLFHIICKAYEFLLNFDCSVLNMQPFIKKNLILKLNFFGQIITLKYDVYYYLSDSIVSVCLVWMLWLDLAVLTLVSLY